MNKKQPSYRWIKRPISYLDDRDYMRLSLEARGLLDTMYLLAGRGDMAGLVGTNDALFTREDIAWFLHLPDERVTPPLSELLQAGMLEAVNNGFQITRFMDEQGAEDDENRARWREYQRQRRAKALNLPESEKEAEKEIEAEKEEEKEKRESRGRGRGRVSSDNVSLSLDNDTTTTPTAATAASSSGILLAVWEEETKIKPTSKYKKAIVETLRQWTDNCVEYAGDVSLRQRLCDCVVAWKHICQSNDWSYRNVDAILELFPIPNLEERMQREDIHWNNADKQDTSQRILKAYGLLAEQG